jgi:hypothetical protein
MMRAGARPGGLFGTMRPPGDAAVLLVPPERAASPQGRWAGGEPPSPGPGTHRSYRFPCPSCPWLLRLCRASDTRKGLGVACGPGDMARRKWGSPHKPSRRGTKDEQGDNNTRGSAPARGGRGRQHPDSRQLSFPRCCAHHLCPSTDASAVQAVVHRPAAARLPRAGPGPQRRQEELHPACHDGVVQAQGAAGRLAGPGQGPRLQGAARAAGGGGPVAPAGGAAVQAPRVWHGWPARQDGGRRSRSVAVAGRLGAPPKKPACHWLHTTRAALPPCPAQQPLAARRLAAPQQHTRTRAHDPPARRGRASIA